MGKPCLGYGATVAQVAQAVTVQVPTGVAVASAWTSQVLALSGKLAVADTVSAGFGVSMT